jgi:hypothetical protein
MKLPTVAIAVLTSVLFAQQSIAAAPSANIDPARERIGQIVYPLGVHAPKDTSKTKGVAAKYPRAQDTGRNKDKNGE